MIELRDITNGPHGTVLVEVQFNQFHLHVKISDEAVFDFVRATDGDAITAPQAVSQNRDRFGPVIEQVLIRHGVAIELITTEMLNR